MGGRLEPMMETVIKIIALFTIGYIIGLTIRKGNDE